LFCQRCYLGYERAYPLWRADNRSRALADTLRLLKGPKLVSHDFFVTPLPGNGLSKTNGRWRQLLYGSGARVCKMLQRYGLQQGVVSHHLRSDLYLGHIFLLDIPATSFAIHRNLRRRKVVENIAMFDYAPISATRTTPCHSKIILRKCTIHYGGV